jgi:hypothetical protein
MRVRVNLIHDVSKFSGNPITDSAADANVNRLAGRAAG